jgi:hypothetical protein
MHNLPFILVGKKNYSNLPICQSSRIPKENNIILIQILMFIFSLNSPRIFIILDIHQQNAQITNKVQIRPLS